MRISHSCSALALVIAMSLVSAHANTDDLLRMSDQLDRLDQLDLQDSLGKAQRCTSERNFPCAETTLRNALKLAHSARDKADLAAAQAQLAAEKRRVEEEERALAERERELRLAEERLMEEEAQARRRAEAREDDSMGTGQAVALFGSLLSQSLQNQATVRAAEARNARNFQAMNDQVAADVARQQRRFAQERAQIETQRAALRRAPAAATGSPVASAAQATRIPQQPSSVPVPRPSTGQAAAGVTAPSTSTVRGLESVDHATLAQIGARAANVNLADVDSRGGKGSAAPSAPTVQIAMPGMARAPTLSQMQRPTSPPVSAQPTQSGSASPAGGGPGGTAPKPADPREPDEDGCIDAIGWCSSAPSMEQRGTTTFLRFKNTCPFRVYGTFINGRADGSADSGATGVAAGATHTWSTPSGSGKGYARIVGSTKASMDWVCSGRMNGFRAGDSTLDKR